MAAVKHVVTPSGRLLFTDALLISLCTASSERQSDMHCTVFIQYRGAEKSLAPPGRKQARKQFRDARDFNNIETRAVIEIFPSLQGKASREIRAIMTETLVSFLVGLRTYQHPCVIVVQNSYMLS